MSDFVGVALFDEAASGVERGICMREMQRLLCSKDVAQRLGLERKTVAALLNARKIVGTRLNGVGSRSVHPAPILCGFERSRGFGLEKQVHQNVRKLE